MQVQMCSKFPQPGICVNMKLNLNTHWTICLLIRIANFNFASLTLDLLTFQAPLATFFFFPKEANCVDCGRRLGQKVVFEHPAKATANGQLATDVRGNN